MPLQLKSWKYDIDQIQIDLVSKLTIKQNPLGFPPDSTVDEPTRIPSIVMNFAGLEERIPRYSVLLVREVRKFADWDMRGYNTPRDPGYIGVTDDCDWGVSDRVRESWCQSPKMMTFKAQL